MNPKETPTQFELWQTCYKWLSSTGNIVSKQFCKEELSTHPDYPALTAIADFLDIGGMEYHAVQADVSHIDKFNYPVLAHIKEPGRQYVHIVWDVDGWNRDRNVTQHWSGTCIYPEKASLWHNKENDAYRQNDKENKLRGLLAVFIGIILFTITVTNNPLPAYILFGLLSMVGVFVSIIATGTEIGVQNNLVKQVCGIVQPRGCDKVLKSGYSKVIANITTGDIATLYFSTQFTIFLCTSFYPQAFNVVGLLSLTGILVAAWSIYTQAVKIRVWCAICLGIVLVLILQFFISFYIYFFTNFKANIGVEAITICIGIGLIISLLFLQTKKLLKTNHIYKQRLAELKKWKLDGGLFITQWENEHKVDTEVWDKDLVIGNPDAPLKIMVACNPYCNPCAKAHKHLDKILETYKGKLSVQLRFLCIPAMEHDKKTIAVKTILQKAAELKDTSELQKMITDWFEIMDYEEWLKIWKPVQYIYVQEQLEKHDRWIKNAEIAVTPTFFINGKKLPGRYDLPELELLIPQLTEETAMVSNNLQI